MDGNKMQIAHIDGFQLNVLCGPETEILVQVGRGKSSYKTRYAFRGELSKAAFYYGCLNVGRGYKKRLLVPSSPHPVVHRTFS